MFCMQYARWGIVKLDAPFVKKIVILSKYCFLCKFFCDARRLTIECLYENVYNLKEL